MVEFDAYAADCRVRGRIEPGGARLTDLLNGTPELVIRDAWLESLADGHVVEAGEITVGLAELHAVVAAGPRGDSARRVRTHVTRVEVELGPYRVEGALHGLPAGDPLGMILRRPPWVPLTDAKITYQRGTGSVTDEVETLLVNRDLARSMRPMEGEAAVLRWEAVSALPGGPRPTVSLAEPPSPPPGSAHPEPGSARRGE